MPRYYFNVHDGTNSPDFDGTDLPDIYSAQAEAVKLCGALIAEIGAKFWDRGEWRLEVSDSGGLLLFTLLFLARETGLARS